MSRRAPGELEGDILVTLWAARGPLTAGEVQAELGDDLALTTVITILTRLVTKGIVRRSRTEGERAYRYAPCQERAEHAAQQMLDLLGTGNERRSVLARFVGSLSPSDRSALGELLGRRGRR